MAKNIVLFSDGTWKKGGFGRDSNVWKLYQALDLHSYNLTDPTSDEVLSHQIAAHDDGVGADGNRFFKILGGAVGFGLGRNVRDLYEFLARNYEPGDRIYMFGFSRGAFTVRTLGGLVLACGIADVRKLRSDREVKKRVREAYRAYRKRYSSLLVRIWRIFETIFEDKEKGPADFRTSHAIADDTHAPNGKITIRMIGVWDTVDAVGFPLPFVTAIWNTLIYRFKFPDLELGTRVAAGRHAVAIDEERYTFAPALWSNGPGNSSHIEQVWFAGVHSNVGGGYARTGLSDITLHWMMEHAHRAGMILRGGAIEDVRDRTNPFDRLYDSRAGIAFFYRLKSRHIGKLTEKTGHQAAMIHRSVFERIQATTDGYAPAYIPRKIKVIPRDDDLESKVRDELAKSHNEDQLASARACSGYARAAHYIMAISLALGFAAAAWHWNAAACSSPDGLLATPWGQRLGKYACMVTPSFLEGLTGGSVVFADKYPIYHLLTTIAVPFAMWRLSLRMRRKVQHFGSLVWRAMRPLI